MENLKYILDLIISITGLVLIIVGWVVPNWIKQKEEKKHWSKSLIDEQISKLYGPISSILNEMQAGYEIVLMRLNRKEVFNDTPLTEKERKIWIDYLDNFNLPMLNSINEIFRANLHLIYGTCIPKCYEDFIKYVIDWSSWHALYKKGLADDYQLHASIYFPTEFKEYIDNTLAILWEKQSTFVKINRNI